MENGNEFNGADIRRVEWLLNRCGGMGCESPDRSIAFASNAVHDSIKNEDQIPVFDYQDNDKVVILSLDFTERTSADLVLASVSFGHAPMLTGSPDILGIDLFDEDDNFIRNYTEWHPLLQLGVLDDIFEGYLEHGPALERL